MDMVRTNEGEEIHIIVNCGALGIYAVQRLNISLSGRDFVGKKQK
jgi:hypothetical protein